MALVINWQGNEARVSQSHAITFVHGE